MGLKIEYSSEFKKALKRQDSYIVLTSCKLYSSKEYVIDDLSVLHDGKYLNFQFSLENADDFILYTTDSTKNEYPVKSIEVYFKITGSGNTDVLLAFTLSDENGEDILLSQFGNLFNIEIPSYWKATIETLNKSTDVIDLNKLESYGETYGRDLFIVDSQKIVSAASELVSKDSYFRFYRLALGDEIISTTYTQLDKFGNINKEVTVNYEYSDFSIYTIGSVKTNSESSNYYVINLDTNGGFLTIKGQATCTKTYYYGSDVIKTETELVSIEKLNNIKLSLDQTSDNLFSDLGNYIIKYENTNSKSQHCTVKATLYQQDGTTIDSNNIFLYFYSNLVVDDLIEDGYEDTHKVVFVDGYYGSYRTFSISCYDVDGIKDSADVNCDNVVLSNFNITVRKNTGKSKEDVVVFDVIVQALQDNNSSTWAPSVDDEEEMPYLITLNFDNNSSEESVFDNTFKFYAIQTPLCNFNIYGTKDEGESLAGVIPTNNTITLPRRTIDNRVVDLGYNVMFDSSVEEQDETCKYYLIENKSEDSNFKVYSNSTNYINSFTNDIDEKEEDDNSLIIEYKHTNNILNEGYSNLESQNFTIYEVEEGVTLDKINSLDWRKRAKIRKTDYKVNIKGAPAIVLITNDAYLENQIKDNETDKLDSSDSDYSNLVGNYGFLFKYPTTLHYKVWNNITCTFSVGSNTSNIEGYSEPSTVSADDYEFSLLGNNDNPTNSDLTTSLEISKNESYYGSDESYFKNQFKDLNILLTKLNFVNTPNKLIKTLNIKSSEIDNGDEIFVYYDFLPKKGYEENIVDLNSSNSYYVIQFDYYKDDNLSFNNIITKDNDTFDVVSFHIDLEKIDEELSYTCADPCYEYQDESLSKSIDEGTLNGEYILLSRNDPTYIYFKSSVYPVSKISALTKFYPPYLGYHLVDSNGKEIKIYYNINDNGSNNWHEDRMDGKKSDTIFYRYAGDNPIDVTIIKKIFLYKAQNNLSEIKNRIVDTRNYNLFIDVYETAGNINLSSNLFGSFNIDSDYVQYSTEVNLDTSSSAEENLYLPEDLLNFSFFKKEYGYGGRETHLYKNIDINFNKESNLYKNSFFNYVYQLKLELTKTTNVYYPVSIGESCIKTLILSRNALSDNENKFNRFDTFYDTGEVQQFLGVNISKFGYNIEISYASNLNVLNMTLDNYIGETLYSTSVPHYITENDLIKNNHKYLNNSNHTYKVLKLISGGLSPKADCSGDCIVVTEDNTDNVYFKESSVKIIYVTTNYPLLNPGQSLLDIFNINLSGNTKFFSTDYSYNIKIFGSTKDSNKFTDLQNRSKNLFCYKKYVDNDSYESKSSGTLSYSIYSYLKDKEFSDKDSLEEYLLFCKIGSTNYINTENELSKLDDLTLHINIYSNSAKTDVLNLKINEISFDEENHIYKYKITSSGTENSFTLSFNIPRIFKEYYNGPEFLSSRSVNPGTDNWDLNKANPNTDDREYYGDSNSHYRNYGYDGILRVNIPRPVLNKTFVFHNLEEDYIDVHTASQGCISLKGNTLQFDLKSDLYQFKVDDEDYKSYILDLLEPILDLSKESNISIDEKKILIQNYDYLSAEKSYNFSDTNSYEKYNNYFPIQDSFKVYKIDDDTEASVSIDDNIIKYATPDRGWVYEDRIYFGDTIKNSQAEIYLRKDSIDSKNYVGQIELFLSQPNGHITIGDAIQPVNAKISNKTSLSASKLYLAEDTKNKTIEITYTKDSEENIEYSTPYFLVLSSPFETWSWKNNKSIKDSFTTNFAIQAYFMPFFKYTSDLFFAYKSDLKSTFYYEDNIKDLKITSNEFVIPSSYIESDNNNYTISNLVKSEKLPFINESEKVLLLNFTKNDVTICDEIKIRIAGLRLVITQDNNTDTENNSYGRLIVSENELIEKHTIDYSFRIYYDTETGEKEIKDYSILDKSVPFYGTIGLLGLSINDGVGKITVTYSGNSFINKNNVISKYNSLIKINDSSEIYQNMYLPFELAIK